MSEVPNCLNCGKDISFVVRGPGHQRKKFCNRKCREIYFVKKEFGNALNHKPKEKAKIKCLFCGKETVWSGRGSERKYCSDRCAQRDYYTKRDPEERRKRQNQLYHKKSNYDKKMRRIRIVYHILTELGIPIPGPEFLVINSNNKNLKFSAKWDDGGRFGYTLRSYVSCSHILNKKKFKMEVNGRKYFLRNV